ncbi:hypothetical protein GIB67_042772, partial [Kingdonia uniflora]
RRELLCSSSLVFNSLSRPKEKHQSVCENIFIQGFMLLLSTSSELAQIAPGPSLSFSLFVVIL